MKTCWRTGHLGWTMLVIGLQSSDLQSSYRERRAILAEAAAIADKNSGHSFAAFVQDTRRVVSDEERLRLARAKFEARNSAGIMPSDHDSLRTVQQPTMQNKHKKRK